MVLVEVDVAVTDSMRARLVALASSVAALPGVLSSADAVAQEPVMAPSIRFQYAGYKEWQSGGADRMHVKSPMFWLQTPVGESGEFEGSFVLDSMSGASPYYHSSLSGASIYDNRRAVDAKYTRYFERFSVSGGVAASNEDDYSSISGLGEVRVWSSDKNTILTLSNSYDRDHVTCSDDSTLDEHKRVGHYLLGLSQVVSPNTVVASSLTFSSGAGFFNDPYKPFDKRPQTHDEIAWLTRLNYYVEPLDGSVHFDYRWYRNSWNVDAHTFEVAWYQPLSNGWEVRPGVRYYTQSRADFFSATYPPTDSEHFYSADARLGDFGGISPHFKLIKDLGAGVSVDAMYEFVAQRPDYKIGSVLDSDIKPLYASSIILGMSVHY